VQQDESYRIWGVNVPNDGKLWMGADEVVFCVRMFSVAKNNVLRNKDIKPRSKLYFGSIGPIVAADRSLEVS